MRPIGLHASDTHLRDRRGDEQYAFKQLVDAALKHKVRYVCLAGDLLDKQSNRAAVIKFLLGWELIPGLDPIFMAPGDQPGEVMRAIEVIGSISCVLLGAYPMVLLLTRWFEKPLMRVGNLLKINNMAAGGMVATLANNIPMFGMMKQMDTRGKVINCAFSVSAAFALGDHLGFAAANMNAMIFPMIVGKLVGGVTAIGVAMLLVPKDENVPAPANNEAEAHS